MGRFKAVVTVLIEKDHATGIPWQISSIQHHEGAGVATCAKTIIVQPRGYLIEPYPARWGPSVKCFVQHPYFVRILAKLLHKSLWWVYIQGILEIGLEVRGDAIKRFELQLAGW